MKIYTYANPFTLESEPYWDEIKSVPHFCVSQTLVQGLCRHYGRHSFRYICTADRIVNVLYPEWYQDVELKIEQYVSVSRQIESISDGKLAKALKFNQQSLVDALRFAVTLNLDAAQFNKAALPREQQVFLDILSNLRDMPCWRFENNPEQYKDRLGAAIESIYRTEMDETLAIIISENDLKLPKDASPADKMYACLEFLGAKTDEAAVRQRKVLEHYTALSINPQIKNISKVVFHAIHQFTPKILSAVKSMENAGVEVIFLFNYQGTYRHMYDTWSKVYEWTGCNVSERPRSDSFECRLISANA